MTLGEKIQELRRKQGLSQKQLAEMVMVTHQAVSRWEQGESTPDIENVLRLSEIFGVSTDYLLRDIDPHKNDEADSSDEAEEGEVVDDDNDDADVGSAFRKDFNWKYGKGDIHIDFGRSRRKRRRRNIIIANAFSVAVVAYLVMGVVWQLWHPGWLVFLAAWFVQDFRGIYRNLYSLALITFLVLGFVWSLWSVAWVAFPIAWLLRKLVRDFRRCRRYRDE